MVRCVQLPSRQVFLALRWRKESCWTMAIRNRSRFSGRVVQKSLLYLPSRFRADDWTSNLRISHELRRITRETGTALVFDEVVTGFRVHLGGAQAHFGVRADIATYGKVVGGGLPIGVVAGDKRYLDVLDGGHWQYGDASFPEVGVTFFAGTCVRHPLALAAAKSVLTHLKQSGHSYSNGWQTELRNLPMNYARSSRNSRPRTTSHSLVPS